MEKVIELRTGSTRGDGAFAEVMAERLGVAKTPVLRCGKSAAPITVTRMRRGAPAEYMWADLPNGDAWAVHLQFHDVSRRRLSVDGRLSPIDPYPAGSISLYDMRRNLVAGIGSAFDCLRFHVPRAALHEVADAAGASRIIDLGFTHGTPIDDPVIRGLGSALLPAMDRPEQANALFVGQVALAFQTHVARTYGGMRASAAPVRGCLAPWQERRAKDLMEARLDGEVSLADVARECHLSISYFARAFKQTTGVPPHRWLLQRRVSRAESLLRESSMPLAEVALTCGFADQSHFGRVFAQMNGAAPGAWQRRQRSARPARNEPPAREMAKAA